MAKLSRFLNDKVRITALGKEYLLYCEIGNLEHQPRSVTSTGTKQFTDGGTMSEGFEVKTAMVTLTFANCAENLAAYQVLNGFYTYDKMVIEGKIDTTGAAGIVTATGVTRKTAFTASIGAADNLSSTVEFDCETLSDVIS